MTAKKNIDSKMPLVITIILLILVVGGTAYDLREQKEKAAAILSIPTPTPTLPIKQ